MRGEKEASKVLVEWGKSCSKWVDRRSRLHLRIARLFLEAILSWASLSPFEVQDARQLQLQITWKRKFKAWVKCSSGIQCKEEQRRCQSTWLAMQSVNGKDETSLDDKSLHHKMNCILEVFFSKAIWPILMRYLNSISVVLCLILGTILLKMNNFLLLLNFSELGTKTR